jgi:hypothetical protein
VLYYRKQEKSKLGPNGRFLLYAPVNGSLSRSPFSRSGAPATAGEMCGSVNLLLLFIFFNIVACDSFRESAQVDNFSQHEKRERERSIFGWFEKRKSSIFAHRSSIRWLKLQRTHHHYHYHHQEHGSIKINTSKKHNYRCRFLIFFFHFAPAKLIRRHRLARDQFAREPT